MKKEKNKYYLLTATVVKKLGGGGGGWVGVGVGGCWNQKIKGSLILNTYVAYSEQLGRKRQVRVSMTVLSFLTA